MLCLSHFAPAQLQVRTALHLWCRASSPLFDRRLVGPTPYPHPKIELPCHRRLLSNLSALYLADPVNRAWSSRLLARSANYRPCVANVFRNRLSSDGAVG